MDSFEFITASLFDAAGEFQGGAVFRLWPPGLLPGDAQVLGLSEDDVVAEANIGYFTGPLRGLRFYYVGAVVTELPDPVPVLMFDFQENNQSKRWLMRVREIVVRCDDTKMYARGRMEANSMQMTYSMQSVESARSSEEFGRLWEGVKWVTVLTTAGRKTDDRDALRAELVDAARKLKAEGYSIDRDGLSRVLILSLSGVSKRMSRAGLGIRALRAAVNSGQ